MLLPGVLSSSILTSSILSMGLKPLIKFRFNFFSLLGFYNCISFSLMPKIMILKRWHNCFTLSLDLIYFKTTVFWALFSVPLVFMLVFLPVLCCFNYCSFIVFLYYCTNTIAVTLHRSYKIAHKESLNHKRTDDKNIVNTTTQEKKTLQLRIPVTVKIMNRVLWM